MDTAMVIWIRTTDLFHLVPVKARRFFTPFQRLDLKTSAALSLLKHRVMYRLGKRPYREFFSRSQWDRCLEAVAVGTFPHQSWVCIPVAFTRGQNMFHATHCLVFRGGYEYVFTHDDTM